MKLYVWFERKAHAICILSCTVFGYCEQHIPIMWPKWNVQLYLNDVYEIKHLTNKDGCYILRSL